MKIAWGKVASGAIAVLVLGVAGTPPAHAQGVPQGSYLQSCNRVGVRGDTLYATCRRVDGYPQQTSLPDVSRCVGDIGNNNGNLTCAYRGGRPPRYGGPPAYEESRPGPVPGERRARCEAAREQVERLRERLRTEFNPLERVRVEERLRQAEYQWEECRR